MDPATDRTAVIYHYFEKDEVYRDNLIFFLARAWRPNLDIFVIISGEVSVRLPERSNTRYVHTQNIGQDFGCFAMLVEDGSLDRYHRLIFLNCTVRGPFLPPYDQRCWTQPFLALLAGDVHLCGATISILHASRPFHKKYEAAFPDDPKPYSHVQSSVHAMTGECLAMLREAGVYAAARTLTKDEAVLVCEIGMSQRVKAAGWNISCLLPAYSGIDYRAPHSEINSSTPNGHPQGAGSYFGQSLHPYESIFLKTGWQALKPEVWDFHTLMALRHHPVAGLDWPEADALIARIEARCDAPLAHLGMTRAD